MKLRELLTDSRFSGRDAYQRDHESSVSGMERPDDHRGLRQELAHETNNIAIAINGKTWKVIPGKGYADSKEEWSYLNNMKNWAEKKSASSGKKWSVHLTGAPVTVSESATAGATSAANIGTVDAPQLSPGKARGKKSYTGSPSSGSGTKAPPQPKVIQPKTKSGTAVNALDMKGANLFGAPVKR